MGSGEPDQFDSFSQLHILDLTSFGNWNPGWWASNPTCPRWTFSSQLVTMIVITPDRPGGIVMVPSSAAKFDQDLPFSRTV